MNKRCEWIPTVIFSIESPILSSKSMKHHLKYATGELGPWFTTTTGVATDASTRAGSISIATGVTSTDTATDANKTLSSSASF